MPFSFYSPPSLSAEQASPYANLISNALKNYGTAVQARYMPLTTQAEAASKLAYANLMGPQFLAKLMGNEDILANMTPAQRNAALDLVYKAGSGQSSGNALLPIFNQIQSPQQETSSSNSLLQNPNLSSQDRRSIPNMNPGDSYVIQGNGDNSGYSYDKSGNNIVATPQQIEDIINRSNPEEKNTFAEKAGTYQGIKKQEEESGKYRAEDIKDFGRQIESGYNISDKYKTLTNLLNNSEFMNLRKDIPFFQDKQLKIISKTGTPYQQELIGNFINTSNEIVGDIITSFGKQKFKGEGDLAKDMKVSDNDTFNVMIGKLQSAMQYKELMMQRAKIASNLMENQHFNKYKALEIADKQINSEKIIKDIADKLDYIVAIRRKKEDGTFEVEQVRRSEARRRGVNV